MDSVFVGNWRLVVVVFKALPYAITLDVLSHVYSLPFFTSRNMLPLETDTYFHYTLSRGIYLNNNECQCPKFLKACQKQYQKNKKPLKSKRSDLVVSVGENRHF